MRGRPLPATAAAYPHSWESVFCTVCGEPFAAVAGFDLSRLEGAPLVCAACSGWFEIRCLRCHRVLGSTRGTDPHSGALVYCRSCSSNDLAAAERRRDHERQKVEMAIAECEVGEADPEGIEP